MNPFKVIPLLLFIFLSTVTAIALPNPAGAVPDPPIPIPTPTSLDPLFIVKTGLVPSSGCSPDDVAELKSAYVEAIQMMAKAQNAINAVQVPHASASDPALWNRQSLLLYELFHIVIDPDTGAVVPPGPDLDADINNAEALNTVTEVFSRAVSHAQAALTTTPSAGNENYVACGSEGIRLLRATDEHPEQPGVQLNAGGAFPHGAYFLAADATGFPNILMTAYPVEGTTVVLEPDEKFCDGITDAHTASSVNGPALVIFCTEAFGEHPNTVEPSAVTAGMVLDSLLSLSVIWAHELTHVWSGTADWEAVSEAPSELKEPERDASGNWVVTPKTQHGELAYGAEPCMLLAINYPDEIINNADSFAMFALGNWLNQWLWVGGLAVKPV